MFIGGLIGSATTVLVDSAYVELNIDIEAKVAKDKKLYSGLAFGNGVEFHTGLYNAIINGSIKAVTTDSDAEAVISIHGYDGSVYGSEEKPSSTIDSETVKYIAISLDVDGADYSYPDSGISFDNISSVVTWNTNVWGYSVEEKADSTKTLNVTFKN